MNQKIIKAIHVYILLIMSTGFMVHVLLLPSILSASHRDSWVAVIFSIVPCILWTLFIFYLYKRLNGEDINTILYKRNKGISSLIRVGFGIYFILNAFITIKFTAIWAEANYTVDIPNFVIVILFVLLCYFASKKGIRTISTLAFLFLPAVVLFGFLVGIGNTPNKNYELLFPLFEEGYGKTMLGLIYTCSGYFEMIVFLFLTPYLKDKLKAKWLIFVGLLFVLLTLGPLIGAISEFGYLEATKMRNPAYEQWRLLILSDYITRLDFLSIYQWLSGAMIRVSLCMFIAEKCLSHSNMNSWLLPLLYVVIAFSSLIKWDATSFFNFLYKYEFPFSLGFLCLGSIVLFYLIRSKGGRHV